MNKQPRKTDSQHVELITCNDAGCMTLGRMEMAPGVAMYHQHSIVDMRINERENYLKYLMVVLYELGHKRGEPQ